MNDDYEFDSDFFKSMLFSLISLLILGFFAIIAMKLLFFNKDNINTKIPLSELELRAYNICIKTDCNYNVYYNLYNTKYNSLKESSTENFNNYFDLFFEDFKNVDKEARSVYSYPITMGDILYALNKTKIHDDIRSIYKTDELISESIPLYYPSDVVTLNTYKLQKHIMIITDEIITFNQTCKKPYPSLYFGKIVSLGEYRKIQYYFERCTK